MSGLARPSSAWGLLVFCAWLAGAGGARAQDVTVTGLSIKVSAGDERLLIAADGPLEFDVEESDPELLQLTLLGVKLGDAVPPSLSGAAGATLSRVLATQGTGRKGPEVVVRMRHAAGKRPLVRRTGEGGEVIFAAARNPRGSERPTPRRRESSSARGVPQISLAKKGPQPLKELIRKVATQSGETILMDSEISKQISIIGSDRYTPAEARALLDTALLLHGHVAVPMPGGGRKIVPISGAPLPWVASLANSPGEEAVTTLVRLEEIEAQFMLNAIQPLVGTETIAVLESASNGILLAGSARKIARLRDAMKILDDAGSERDVIWAIAHREAGDMLELIEDAFPEDVSLGRADGRTNRLVLRVRAERVADLRRFISRIDRPPVGTGGFHVLRVKNADPEALASRIDELRAGGGDASQRDAPLSGSEFAIQADPGSHSLVLRADPETAQIVADLVAELDVHPPRVRLYVTVREVFSTDNLRLGFDAFVPAVPANDTIVAFATNPSGGGIQGIGNSDDSFVSTLTRRPIVLPVVDPFGNPVEVSQGSFAITADENYFESDVLFAPELLVASGEEQEIFSGDNIPLLVSSGDGTETTSNGVLQARQNVERHDTGVLLRVTPTVGSKGGVRLELFIEVSALSGSSAGQVDRVGPTIIERTIEATVHLQSENVAVLGFATEPIESYRMVGVPFLSRLPLIGFLFRQTTKEVRMRTLLATVQAVIEREDARELTAVLEEHLFALDAAKAALPAAEAGG